MPDETPTPGEILEFGDPSTNAVVEILPGDILHDDPDAEFTDEVPDLGLE